MENSDRAYLLDKFLKNQLTAEEQQQWDRLLDEDTAFKEQAFFEKDVKKAITRNERQELRSFLQSIEVRGESKPFKWKAVAASFIGFMIITTIALFLFRDKPSEKLYLSYYQPYPNMIAPAVRGTVDTSSIAKAFEAYDTENYRLSAQLFDELYEPGKPSFALLYSGISHLENGHTATAIQKFQQLNARDDDFQDVAQWYLALAFLKDGKRDFTEELLKDLGKRDTEFSEQARELLKGI